MARGLIENPENWAKGGEQVRGGRHCVESACYASADPYRAEFALRLFELANATTRFGRPCPACHWNDDPERTHVEVLSAFDKAIELAKQEEG